MLTIRPEAGQRIWITGDTHFNHTNIIKYCNRPFSTVEEMNQILLDNLNSKVGSKDLLLHLGDFCFYSKSLFALKTVRFLEQIKCKYIYLVLGNHDAKSRVMYKDAGLIRETTQPSNAFPNFAEVCQELKFHYNNNGESIEFRCSHYPPTGIIPSKGAEGARGSRIIWLHGHCHGKRMKSTNVIDCGVDCWNYQPIGVENILTDIDQQIANLPEIEAIDGLDPDDIYF